MLSQIAATLDYSTRCTALFMPLLMYDKIHMHVFQVITVREHSHHRWPRDCLQTSASQRHSFTLIILHCWQRDCLETSALQRHSFTLIILHCWLRDCLETSASQRHSFTLIILHWWQCDWSRDQCITAAQLHTNHSPLLTA